jgi:uncharacterized protein YoaH (UPF0181 family)
MLTDMPALTHEQQQQAVERIQELMAEGMSSGEAIRQVSTEIRANHTGERVSIRWDDDEDDEPADDEAGNAVQPDNSWDVDEKEEF